MIHGPTMGRDALCFSCLFVDERPELGFNGNLIYCMKKGIVVTPKKMCDLFVAATEHGKEEMRNAIYGRYSEIDMHEE